MKIRSRVSKIIIFTSVFLVFVFVLAPLVSARRSPEPSPRMPEIRGEKTATPSSKKKPKSPRDKLKDRLAEVKLKVCEKKEASIQKRSGGLAARAGKIKERFDRIVAKVDAFYIDKVIPKAGEIENYGQLLNSVEDQRQNVAAALGVAESTAANFDCSGSNPKDQLKQFRLDMKGVIRALQDYKKTVINLLVAVKTKGKNIKSPVATESAKPATPSAGQ